MRKSGIINSNGAEAVNFCEIRMSNIAPNTLYRSSHPIKDNKQEKIISLLAAQNKIQVVLQLISAMGNYMPVNDQNLQSIAENYLLKMVKLSAVEIGLL